jgi:hypothetical protein
MSGLTYTANVAHVALGNATQDLFELLTATGNPITIHRIECSIATINQASTYFQLLTRSSAGSGGTGVTPAPTQRLNTRAAATVFNRTVTTPGGAGVVLNTWEWNVVAPFDSLLGKPDLEIEIPAATRIGFFLGAAVGTPNASWSISFSER